MQPQHKQTKPLAGSVSVSAICVDPKTVKDVWPRVSRFILAAMRKGDLGTFDALEADVLSGDALLWLAVTEREILSVAVTQLIKTECSRVCMIQACGGNGINNWLDLIGMIEAYAKDEKCDCVRLMGRKGWERMLRHYKVDKVVMERRL